MTDTSERERQCLELRRAGLTFDAIAERVGYKSRTSAAAAYERALRRTGQQTTAEVRELEVDRLDRLQVAVWPKAIKGDLPAVDRVLRIGEQRAKLRGLSTPNAGDLRRSFDESINASDQVRPVDGALIEAGRKIADRVDEAIATGEGQELTKALYLMPHMVNILREMLATPAARKAAGVAQKESAGGKLAQLRSVQTNRSTA